MADDEAPSLEEDQPLDDAPDSGSASDTEPEQPEEAQAGDSEQDSFYEFDPALPDDMDPREWASKRHKEMQAAFTKGRQADAGRATQAEQQAEQYLQVLQILEDPNHPQYRAVVANFPHLAAQAQSASDDEFDYEDDDEEANALKARLAKLEGFYEQQQSQTVEQAELAYVSEQLDEIENREGREISDDEAQAIYDLAKRHPDERGIPNVQAAFKHIDGILKAQNARYARSKKAPRSLGNGPAARKQFDIRNESERMEAAEAAAEAAMRTG